MINSGSCLGLGFGFISTSDFFSIFLITGFGSGLSFAFTASYGCFFISSINRFGLGFSLGLIFFVGKLST